MPKLKDVDTGNSSSGSLTPPPDLIETPPTNADGSTPTAPAIHHTPYFSSLAPPTFDTTTDYIEERWAIPVAGEVLRETDSAPKTDSSPKTTALDQSAPENTSHKLSKCIPKVFKSKPHSGRLLKD